MMTNQTVYLAGPRQENGHPYTWHDYVKLKDPSIDWINPFLIHDNDATGKEIYRGDLDAIRDADAILLHRAQDTEICGAYIESGIAGIIGVPTVVHDEVASDPPEFLEWHADSIHSRARHAVDAVLDIVA